MIEMVLIIMYFYLKKIVCSFLYCFIVIGNLFIEIVFVLLIENILINNYVFINIVGGLLFDYLGR